MSDIVDRLRAEEADFCFECNARYICGEAADEIEKLQAAAESDQTMIRALSQAHERLAHYRNAEIEKLRDEIEAWTALHFGDPACDAVMFDRIKHHFEETQPGTFTRKPKM